MPETALKMLLTPADVAEMLHKNRDEVYRLLERDLLPGAVRLAGRWYVRRLVLEAWLRGELEQMNKK